MIFQSQNRFKKVIIVCMAKSNKSHPNHTTHRKGDEKIDFVYDPKGDKGDNDNEYKLAE